MNTPAISLAFIGLILALGSMILYVRTIPRGKVPVKVGGFVSRLILGALLCLLALYLGVTGERTAGVLVYIPAVLGVLASLPFLFLLSQPKAPLGDISVKVGDHFLPFNAKTTAGTSFDSSAFEGKRILLKFYRGGWCPYCSAELVAFDKMTPELDKLGVSIFALSKDTPDEATLHQLRDNLSMTLLSDSAVEVIRTYGVEHHKALGITKNPKSNVFGVPLGTGGMDFQTMAIPTTLLIDESGIIRWIDQSEDYRIRSSTDRVMAAVQAAFKE